LEPLVVAPAPFVLVLLPATLANATFGTYALGATLAWGRLAFGIPIDLAHPLWFALAVPTTILGLGMLGLLLASTFVLYRHANALSNMLEYPVWLVTGLLVPISLLPGWAAPIGWLLAPTWGVRAVRESALGGDPLPETALTAGLAVAYVALAVVFLNLFMRLARERATLSLT
jgi:ABC-2 type transport system permease protein